MGKLMDEAAGKLMGEAAGKSAGQSTEKSAKRRRNASGAKNTQLIFGVHSALSRIERAPATIRSALIDSGSHNSRLKHLADKLAAAQINPQYSDRKQLDKLSNGGNHQGVLLNVMPPIMPREKDLPAALAQLDKPLILVLDQVTDPHNLGACLRTAEGAGVDLLIVPKDGACPLTETVHRVASGAADSMHVYAVTNLARTLRLLKDKGIWVIGMAADSPSFIGADYPAAVAFVMGAEGSGLRRLVAEQCDELLSIPMYGSVASLNVSVAAGVVLYSCRQSRRENI